MFGHSDSKGTLLYKTQKSRVQHPRISDIIMKGSIWIEYVLQYHP